MRRESAGLRAISCESRNASDLIYRRLYGQSASDRRRSAFTFPVQKRSHALDTLGFSCVGLSLARLARYGVQFRTVRPSARVGLYDRPMTTNHSDRPTHEQRPSRQVVP